MSKKGLKEFMEYLKSNEEASNKLKEMGSDVNKMISFGKEHGYEFGVEDLQNLQAELAKSDVEFSDEDLEKVAGGIVTTSAVAAGAAVVAAATMIAANLKDIGVEHSRDSIAN